MRGLVFAKIGHETLNLLSLVVYVFLVEEPTVSNKSLNGSNSNYMLRLYSLHGSSWEVAGLNPVLTGVTTL